MKPNDPSSKDYYSASPYILTLLNQPCDFELRKVKGRRTYAIFIAPNSWKRSLAAYGI